MMNDTLSICQKAIDIYWSLKSEAHLLSFETRFSESSFSNSDVE